ncbi:hypothetical protein [Motilibacter peucedani]|uniref:hypothetical protein n=1 Tax=Motilibacter peucedani TaxID=598650 RepID=UPI0011C432FC|nr:hypothetical protein [Motilibacter peucedani]
MLQIERFGKVQEGRWKGWWIYATRQSGDAVMFFAFDFDNDASGMVADELWAPTAEYATDLATDWAVDWLSLEESERIWATRGVLRSELDYKPLPSRSEKLRAWWAGRRR